MLIAGMVAGELVARIRIPRVTGYLLAGLLVGPSVTGLIKGLELRNFDLIAQLALGLILFNIGGEFEAGHVRRFGRKLLTVTLFQMTLTWLLVTCAIWAVSGNGVLACLTGFIAMETAPAATLLVVKEYESEGPLTNNLIALVGINNIICLSLFPVVVALLFGHFEGSIHAPLTVGKSLVVGVALGLAVSFLEEYTRGAKGQLLVGLGAVTLALGLSYRWGGSPPLSALVMGMAKVNSSAHGPALIQKLDEAVYPLYVLFFVIAGANLHLDTLRLVGLVGAAYITARTIAKIAGTAWGAHSAGLSHLMKGYLGPAMLSHAGVAIGMAMALGRQGTNDGIIAQTLVLGSVVVFELLGPIAVRFSLVRSGEVKMASLLPHAPGHSGLDNLEKVLHQVRRSLGIPMKRMGPTDRPLAAKHLMRSNVETVPDTAHFDELLKIISHARYDLLPVIDKEGKYVGNISFPQIRDVIFDQTLADLLIARDLLDHETAYVTPDEPLAVVLQKFHEIPYEVGSLPVVAESKNPNVVGMIRQRDIVDMFRLIRSGNEERTRSR